MPVVGIDAIGVPGSSSSFNVKTQFGAKGDGVTDDSLALQTAYTAAEQANGALFMPPGFYRYSSKIFDIKNKVAIYGAGKRQTILKPLPAYHGYAMTITDCWRNGEEQADDTTLSLTASKGGVHLEGFSIVGDRTVGGNRGIQTIGTNDFLTMRDIDFVLLDGTALQLGVQSDAFHTSCVRECLFENLQFELSGNFTEPALDLGGGADGASGDGSNDLTFVHINFANNKGVHWRMQAQTSQSLRGVNAYGLIVNGDGPEASSPTAADLIQIIGNVGGVNLHGYFLSGTATVAGTPYAGIRVGSNAAGTPDRIKLQGDVVSILGDAYVIDKCNGITISGTSGVVTGVGATELKVAAGQPGSFNLQYDVISQQSVAGRQTLISIGDEAAASLIYGTFREGTTLTASDGDTTPDVRNASILFLNNTAAQNVTDFDFGGKGHRLTVVGAFAGAENTLIHSASLLLHGGVSRVLQKNEVIRFFHNSSTIWTEEAPNTSYLIADGWLQDNVVANQNNVELTRADGRWRAVRGGSVTGIVVTATEPRTAGTLTIKVFKNTGLAGAAGAQLGTLTAVLDGTNTTRKSSLQGSNNGNFAAGDELYITVTTDAGWLPVTLDIRCALEITT